MTKQIFMCLLIAFVFMVNTGLSQIELGFRGGINLANLNVESTGEEQVDLLLDTESQGVMGVGGVLQVGISKHFGILVEPTYLEKGAKKSEEGAEVTWKAAYLEIPLLLKAGFGAGKFRPFLLAGPSIGINLSSDLKLSGDGLSLKLDVKDLLTTTDLSVLFGGGVLFSLQSMNIYADLRYSLGFADIFEGGTLSLFGIPLVVPDAEVKTRGVQIMAGLLFPLGSK